MNNSPTPPHADLDSAYHAGSRPGRLASKRRAGIVAAVAITVVALTGGSALAYWSTTGSGNGTASAGSATLSATVTDVTGLYPGSSQTAAVTITNTGNGSQTIQSISPAAVASGSCPADALSFTVPTPLPTVVAGESQQVNVSISMLTTAPDACQGVTVGVTYSVNGKVG